MTRPTVAEIHLPALRHNFQALRSLLPGETKMIVVVKANAYGHGAVPVALALEAEGAAMLAVATVEEGIELRRGGVRAPVLVFGEVDLDQAEEAQAHSLSAVMFDRRQVPLFDGVAKKTGKPFPIHVKVDTGMGRLGFTPEAALRFLADLPAYPGLKLEGWMTHLSSADGCEKEDHAFTRTQLSVFADGAIKARKTCGFVMVHALNSAGILAFGDQAFDAVRPGIALYGYTTLPPDSAPVSLRPVMRIVSRVISIKEVPNGHFVSYNRRFVCRGARRIAAVPIGYADGYRRGLTGHARMTVEGMKAKVAGTICMDLTLLDVTGIPGVGIGSEVEVMGEASMTAAEIADICGTISYEVLTGIGLRVPRKVVD
ncbi:MAG: alanine racemase [Syntrophorhabdaceae bacterium]|nr:alanine racemase [Syntrophorhabdaceae bacterium]